MRLVERVAFIAFWALILIIVVGSVIYAFVASLDNITKLAVAVVGVGGAILGALVNHSLTLQREQEAERRRMMQQNYSVLLDRICKYVRNNRKDEDALDSAHLYSWIVGTSYVIRETVEFMDNPSTSNLRQLLMTMREDIGLSTHDLTAVELKVLQSVNAPGALGTLATRH